MSSLKPVAFSLKSRIPTPQVPSVVYVAGSQVPAYLCIYLSFCLDFRIERRMYVPLMKMKHVCCIHVHQLSFQMCVLVLPSNSFLFHFLSYEGRINSLRHIGITRMNLQMYIGSGRTLQSLIYVRTGIGVCIRLWIRCKVDVVDVRVWTVFFCFA